MDITSPEIENELRKLEIDFSWDNTSTQAYTIASLFNPINKGFYYFTNSSGFPEHIKESLIIVPNSYAVTDKSNAFIKINERQNPQEVYYRLLSNLYGRKSNGNISQHAMVADETELGDNVQIDAFSLIESDVKIGNNVIIGSNVRIHSQTIIEDNVIIESNSVIGAQGVAWTWNEHQTEKIILPQLGGVTIQRNSFLGAHTVIVRGSLNEHTLIGKNCLVAPGCRLGHGTILGDYCHFANNITTGGNTHIGAYSFIGSGAIFRPKVKIHPKTIVGAGALVIKDTTTENKTLIGVPAKEKATPKAPSGMPKPKK